MIQNKEIAKMAIVQELNSEGTRLTINVTGRFDFGSHRDFRESYEALKSSPELFTVNLKETNFLDSSALGMLLLLRDHANASSAKVEIVNCSPEVRKILAISNFEQLFAIH